MPIATRRPSPAINDNPPEEDGLEQIATLAKALGHPARVNIVRMLIGK